MLKKENGLGLSGITDAEKRAVVDKLRKALYEHGEVVLAILHGSFLRDTSPRGVDVAIYARGCPAVLGLKLKLGEELSELTGLPVDVKVLNDAPSWFMKKVLEDGLVIVNKAPSILEGLSGMLLENK